ncbi:MAG: (2Fe-2S)-binding protein [Gammaproteobacteria bacterium]
MSQTLSVNGTEYTTAVDPEMPLLWYLREHLDLTGTKYGCGRGLCGACTVHLDGEAVRSCRVRMRDAFGKAVTTIEGLSPDGSHPLQVAWVRHRVPQCGYCQPGQIMNAAGFLAQNPTPDRESVDQAMRGNLCRCGTYNRIRAAILDVAAGNGEDTA